MCRCVGFIFEEKCRGQAATRWHACSILFKFFYNTSVHVPVWEFPLLSYCVSLSNLSIKSQYAGIIQKKKTTYLGVKRSKLRLHLDGRPGRSYPVGGAATGKRGATVNYGIKL